VMSVGARVGKQLADLIVRVIPRIVSADTKINSE
jgi:hypothetical protein